MYKVKNGIFMGLAASQARLLTITSRMSNNELRQQRIAMDKMRLASDSDKVANEYSNAINNQLLKFNNKSFTISDLEAAGYSVMKTASGVTSSSGVYSGAEVAKPTCKRPEEIEKPAILSQVNNNSTVVYATLPSHVSTQYFDQTHEIANDYDYVQAAFNLVRDTFVADDGTVSNSTKGGYNYEKTTAKRNELWNEMGEPMIKNLVSKLQSSNPELANKLQSCCASITTTLNSLANKTDKNASRSDMNIYKDTNSIVTIQSNLLLDGGYWDKLKASTIGADDYNSNGQKVPTSKTTPTSGEMTAEQKEAYTQWQKDVQEATTAWNNYDAYINARDKATGATDEQKELYNQLKQSPEFLNKGLLSGYLTLVNSSGEMVSTTSDTNFTTEYDKSDDAAAEAKYNSETAKINRKEKLLDQQAKQLETEYNTLNTELNSIKSIISDHASKDFSMFS